MVHVRGWHRACGNGVLVVAQDLHYPAQGLGVLLFHRCCSFLHARRKMPPLSLKITGGGVVVPLSAWVTGRWAGAVLLCFFDYSCITFFLDPNFFTTG